MSEIAFVRTDVLPQLPPPALERGVIKWLRENLFSSPMNALLTVVSLAVLYWLVAALTPWFANSVWDAANLDGCREILGDKTGACFAVLVDRWPQIIFGPTYPASERWRAVTTFVLMFVAMAPLLYPPLPRKMLWFSGIFPFLAVWLIWGGSLWGPIMVAFGFVLGWMALLVTERYVGRLIALILAVVTPLFWWYFHAASAATFFESLVSIDLPSIQSRDLGGLQIALVIGVSGIVLSLPLGIILALGRQSNLFVIHTLSVGFIEFVRGVPLITILFFAMLILGYFLPPGVTFDVVLRVIILVTFFSAAYMAETIRGGLAALPKGQTEAANALGMDYWTTQRQVILPQALKISIPGIVNNFIGLFKDTTLVAFIGIYDMLGTVSAIRASTDWQGVNWELFFAVGLIFFIFCFSMSRYSMWLERRLRTDRR